MERRCNKVCEYYDLSEPPIQSKIEFPTRITQVLAGTQSDFGNVPIEKEYGSHAILKHHQTGCDKESEISVRKRTLEVTRKLVTSRVICFKLINSEDL